jgi:prepilin-type N-terminal cleavage/methylation domain-containing protein
MRKKTAGFTLIEVILVMTMLVLVLTITYGLLLDCLDAERRIEKMTLPEKVGEGILSLVRQDLSGTIYRNLGQRVFIVVDGGAQPEARDEIRFLSTVEPTPREESAGGATVAVDVFRTITGVGYFLRPSPVTDNVSAFTLFRKEITALDQASPLDAPGYNFEIYDKVKSLSFECFDGWEWVTAWDSESRILEESQRLQAEQADAAGITRVSDPARNPAPGSPGVAPESSTGTGILPPAAVPLAVRVEVSIYVGMGNKVERDPQGNPIVKTYATIVPLLAAQRIPIEIEDESALAGSSSTTGAPGEDGDFEFGGPGSGPDGMGRRGGPGGQGARGAGGRRGEPGLGAQGFQAGPGAPGSPRRGVPGGGTRGAGGGGPAGGAPRGR